MDGRRAIFGANCTAKKTEVASKGAVVNGKRTPPIKDCAHNPNGAAEGGIIERKGTSGGNHQNTKGFCNVAVPRNGITGAFDGNGGGNGWQRNGDFGEGGVR